MEPLHRFISNWSSRSAAAAPFEATLGTADGVHAQQQQATTMGSAASTGLSDETRVALEKLPAAAQAELDHVARMSGIVHTAPKTIDLARYTEPASIWEALATLHVRLVKMSWLITHSKAGGVLARRPPCCA